MHLPLRITFIFTGIMRSWIILCGLTAIATAYPLAQSSSVFANTKPPAGWADFLGKIDMSHTSESAMEGPCPDIMLVVARGSGEPGTIVSPRQSMCKSVCCLLTGRQLGRNDRPNAVQKPEGEIWLQVWMSRNWRGIQRWNAR